MSPPGRWWYDLGQSAEGGKLHFAENDEASYQNIIMRRSSTSERIMTRRQDKESQLIDQGLIEGKPTKPLHPTERAALRNPDHLRAALAADLINSSIMKELTTMEPRKELDTSPRLKGRLTFSARSTSRLATVRNSSWSNEEIDDVVESAEKVRGYEISRHTYMEVEDDELDAVACIDARYRNREQPHRGHRQFRAERNEQDVEPVEWPVVE